MRKRTSTQKNKKMSPGLKRFLTVLLSIGFTGFTVCLIVGSYVLHDFSSRVNGERLIDLEFYKMNQDQTTIIYAKDKEDNFVELKRLHGEQNRVWVDMKDMSPWMGKAFVAIEDKRFYEHHGVDWIRTTGVVVKNFFKQGGSTITQQLIKNLTGEQGRTLNRKYNEIVSALNFEKYYPEKDTILEAYMNTVYLSHGCYGVKTAAEKYFGKDVSELNIAECASLAGITQSPEEFDPLWNPDANKTRQELVLSFMHEQGMITEEEYNEAKNYELIFTNSEKYVEREEAKGESPEVKEIQNYYIDYVISSVIKDLKAAGYSSYEANRMIYSGGLRIYSAVDTRIQDIMETVYEQRINFPSERVSKDKKPMQSAMTVMDYTGRVVGIVGGAGQKTQNRTNNRAISAIRQPGSSIKPLSVYAPAIEENFATWGTKINNYGIIWKGERWPTNYGHNTGGPDSYVTTQYALQQSLNTVPAQLLMKMSFKKSYSYLTDKFHITTLNDKVDAVNPSPLATGGTTGGVTTLQMAAAFASFGNGGKYYKPYCYYEVKDSAGNVLLQNKPEENVEQILSPETAYVMNEMLRTVMTYGTGRGSAVSGFTTFGKTGTSGTSDDSYDRWCVAGTPYYVGAVWFGYDTLIPLHVSGNPAGTIFQTIMNRIHKNLAPKSFEKPEQAVQRSYCTVSGLLAGDGCTSKATGWYKASNLPGVCTKCNGAPPVEESTTNAVDTPTPPPVESTTAPSTTPPPTEPPAPPAEPEVTP